MIGGRRNSLKFGINQYLFILLTLIGLSCSKKAPEGILTKKEMAKALTDFYLKEAVVNNLHVGSDSALVLFKYYRQQYVKQNTLADSLINRSYQYYLDHPKELNEIYDIVIDSLTLKEQKSLIDIKRPQ